MSVWFRRALGFLLLAALLGGVALLLLVRGISIPRPSPPPSGEFELRGVTLVEPGVGRRSAQDLRVRAGRIVAIEPTSGSGEEGEHAGMFVLPGLVDAHVHWPIAAWPGLVELFAFETLAHGVTSVRTMGDLFDEGSREARAAIESGDFPGPFVSTCLRFVDGPEPTWPGSLTVGDPSAAAAAVDSLVEDGADCVKVYDHLDAPSLEAIRARAARVGLPVVGHVPMRVDLLDAKLDDVQHLRGVPDRRGGERSYPYFLRDWLELDEARLDAVIALSLERGTAHTPTLVTIDRLLAGEEGAELPSVRYLPAFFGEVLWDPVRGLHAARFLDAEDFRWLRRAFETMKRSTVKMARAGVELRTGSDVMAPGVPPGGGLRRELELWEEAGLSPEEVLAASTGASARAIRGPDAGRLEVGAPADFVIYREDPTRDLAALDTLVAVSRGGRLYTKEWLDEQRAAYGDALDGFTQKTVVPGVLGPALDTLLSRRERAR